MTIRIKTTQRGFTLIELLVVVAVIGLLIGLLLPVLGKARLAGQRIASLSNLRQISVADAAYQAEWEETSLFVESWSLDRDEPFMRGVVPGAENIGGPFINFRGLRLGGMSMHPSYSPYAYHESDKPLNAYLYDIEPSRPGVRPAIGISPDASTRTQREVFFNPASDVELANDSEGFEFEDTSAYNLVGTSYFGNVFWVDAEIDGFTRDTYAEYSGVFYNTHWNFSEYVVPQITRWSTSKTILAADAEFMMAAHQGLSDEINEIRPYGREGEFLAAFVDGHAKAIEVGAEDINPERQSVGNRILSSDPQDAAFNDDSGAWQLYKPFRLHGQ